MDRGLRYSGALTRPLSAQIRSVHRAGFHRHSVLFHHGSRGRSGLSDPDFVYVRRGTNARRRHRLLPVPQHPDFLGRHCWYGHRLYVCRSGWHEGHHLHPSCSVLCIDLCLSGARHFHFHADYRHTGAADWTGRGSRRRLWLIGARQA